MATKKPVVKENIIETDVAVATETLNEACDVPVKDVSEKEIIKKPEKKVYGPTDPVECVSITSGELGMTGIKSGINYRWAGRGDVTEVEYQDLVAAIRSGKKHILAPYFIIIDKEFLSAWPNVEKIYASMFSIKDLTDVLKLDPASMKNTIMKLPEGAKESIKNIASSMIANGQLDSVQKIKVLDEIFDTKFMLMTELFG